VAEQSKGRDASPSIDELLDALTELRELDRRRNAHAPGSPAHDRVSRDLEDRTRRLMDRFRDWKAHGHGVPAPQPAATFLHLARPDGATTIGGTRTG
jgi:hypothetical protein